MYVLLTIHQTLLNVVFTGYSIDCAFQVV